MSYPYYHPYFNPHAGASINQSPLIDFPIIKHLEGHTPRTEAEITTYGERLSSLRLRRALLVFPVLAIICVECRATYLLIQPTSIYGWAATLPIAGLLAYNLSNLVWWTYLRTAGGDSAPPRGPCRKTPGALYVESGRERTTPLLFYFPMPADASVARYSVTIGSSSSGVAPCMITASAP